MVPFPRSGCKVFALFESQAIPSIKVALCLPDATAFEFYDKIKDALDINGIEKKVPLEDIQSTILGPSCLAFLTKSGKVGRIKLSIGRRQDLCGNESGSTTYDLSSENSALQTESTTSSDDNHSREEMAFSIQNTFPNGSMTSTLAALPRRHQMRSPIRNQFDSDGLLQHLPFYMSDFDPASTEKPQGGKWCDKLEEHNQKKTSSAHSIIDADVSGKQKTANFTFQAIGDVEWWCIEQKVLFKAISGLLTELLAVDNEGKLYAWRWCDVAENAGLHPRQSLFGLSSERIHSLCADGIRATALTASGKVATFYDTSAVTTLSCNNTSKELMVLEHPAIMFESLRNKTVVALDVNSTMTSIATSDGCVYMWGIYPKSIRNRHILSVLQQYKATHPPLHVRSANEIATQPVIGKKVSIKGIPIYLPGSVGIFVSCESASTGILLDVVHSMDKKYRFRREDGTIANWPLSAVIFIHASTSPYTGRIVKIDGSHCAVSPCSEQQFVSKTFDWNEVTLHSIRDIIIEGNEKEQSRPFVAPSCIVHEPQEIILPGYVTRVGLTDQKLFAWTLLEGPTTSTNTEYFVRSTTSPRQSIYFLELDFNKFELTGDLWNCMEYVSSACVFGNHAAVSSPYDLHAGSCNRLALIRERNRSLVPLALHENTLFYFTVNLPPIRDIATRSLSKDLFSSHVGFSATVLLLEDYPILHQISTCDHHSLKSTLDKLTLKVNGDISIALPPLSAIAKAILQLSDNSRTMLHLALDMVSPTTPIPSSFLSEELPTSRHSRVANVIASFSSTTGKRTHLTFPCKGPSVAASLETVAVLLKRLSKCPDYHQVLTFQDAFGRTPFFVAVQQGLFPAAHHLLKLCLDSSETIGDNCLLEESVCYIDPVKQSTPLHHIWLPVLGIFKGERTELGISPRFRRSQYVLRHKQMYSKLSTMLLTNRQPFIHVVRDNDVSERLELTETLLSSTFAGEMTNANGETVFLTMMLERIVIESHGNRYLQQAKCSKATDSRCSNLNPSSQKNNGEYLNSLFETSYIDVSRDECLLFWPNRVLDALLKFAECWPCLRETLLIGSVKRRSHKNEFGGVFENDKSHNQEDSRHLDSFTFSLLSTHKELLDRVLDTLDQQFTAAASEQEALTVSSCIGRFVRSAVRVFIVTSEHIDSKHARTSSNHSIHNISNSSLQKSWLIRNCISVFERFPPFAMQALAQCSKTIIAPVCMGISEIHSQSWHQKNSCSQASQKAPSGIETISIAATFFPPSVPKCSPVFRMGFARNASPHEWEENYSGRQLIHGNRPSNRQCAANVTSGFESNRAYLHRMNHFNSSDVYLPRLVRNFSDINSHEDQQEFIHSQADMLVSQYRDLCSNMACELDESLMESDAVGQDQFDISHFNQNHDLDASRLENHILGSWSGRPDFPASRTLDNSIDTERINHNFYRGVARQDRLVVDGMLNNENSGDSIDSDYHVPGVSSFRQNMMSGSLAARNSFLDEPALTCPDPRIFTGPDYLQNRQINFPPSRRSRDRLSPITEDSLENDTSDSCQDTVEDFYLNDSETADPLIIDQTRLRYHVDDNRNPCTGRIQGFSHSERDTSHTQGSHDLRAHRLHRIRRMCSSLARDRLRRNRNSSTDPLFLRHAPSRVRPVYTQHQDRESPNSYATRFVQQTRRQQRKNEQCVSSRSFDCIFTSLSSAVLYSCSESTLLSHISTDSNDRSESLHQPATLEHFVSPSDVPDRLLNSLVPEDQRHPNFTNYRSSTRTQQTSCPPLFTRSHQLSGKKKIPSTNNGESQPILLSRIYGRVVRAMIDAADSGFSCLQGLYNCDASKFDLPSSTQHPGVTTIRSLFQTALEDMDATVDSVWSWVWSCLDRTEATLKLRYEFGDFQTDENFVEEVVHQNQISNPMLKSHYVKYRFPTSSLSNFVLSMLRSSTSEHAHAAPIPDINNLKHVTVVFDAIVYYWKKRQNINFEQSTLNVVDIMPPFISLKDPVLQDDVLKSPKILRSLDCNFPLPSNMHSACPLSQSKQVCHSAVIQRSREAPHPKLHSGGSYNSAQFSPCETLKNRKQCKSAVTTSSVCKERSLAVADPTPPCKRAKGVENGHEAGQMDMTLHESQFQDFPPLNFINSLRAYSILNASTQNSATSDSFVSRSVLFSNIDDRIPTRRWRLTLSALAKLFSHDLLKETTSDLIQLLNSQERRKLFESAVQADRRSQHRSYIRLSMKRQSDAAILKALACFLRFLNGFDFVTGQCKKSKTTPTVFRGSLASMKRIFPYKINSTFPTTFSNPRIRLNTYLSPPFLNVDLRISFIGEPATGIGVTRAAYEFLCSALVSQCDLPRPDEQVVREICRPRFLEAILDVGHESLLVERVVSQLKIIETNPRIFQFRDRSAHILAASLNDMGIPCQVYSHALATYLIRKQENPESLINTIILSGLLHSTLSADKGNIDRPFDLHQLFYKPEEGWSFMPCPMYSSSNSNLYRLSLFYLTGCLAGICLRSNIVFPLQLSRHVLKYMLGQKVQWHDLAFHDFTLFNSLQRLFLMKENAPKEIENMGLTFQVSIPFGHSKKPEFIELRPNGDDIEVTSDNVVEFIREYALYIMVQSIQMELVAIRTGLLNAVSHASLQHLTIEDLQHLLGGLNIISISLLRSITNFDSEISSNLQPCVEQAKKWFWEILSDMNQQQLHDLLFFWTSMSTLPANVEDRGFALYVIFQPPSNNFLPTAATCSSQLRIPCYPSKEIFEMKLLQAIQTRSFGFL